MSRQSPFVARSAIDSLVTMLATLRHAPDGPGLLAQIQAGKDSRDAMIALVDHAFAVFAKNAVDRYAKIAPTDPTKRLKLKMIDHRLEALLGADAKQPEPHIDDAATLEQHLVAALWATSQPEPAPHLNARAPGDAAPSPTLSALQQTLDSQLEQAIHASLDSVASLGSVEQTLHSVPADALAEWREILCDAARETIETYRNIERNLQEARVCAKEMARQAPRATSPLVAADRQELVQRLEAETRRAERHRHPLSVALLNPDHIDDIRHVVGSDAVREVLRFYRESLASCARAYDTIAGYKPHGLFWLLPSASTEQSVRALRKAQERMADAHYQYGGRLRRLPTFSAAVASYASGESPSALLARVETLAQRARAAGPGRIEREAESGTVLTG